jgi:hypothetical protein
MMPEKLSTAPLAAPSADFPRAPPLQGGASRAGQVRQRGFFLAETAGSGRMMQVLEPVSILFCYCFLDLSL